MLPVGDITLEKIRSAQVEIQYTPLAAELPRVPEDGKMIQFVGNLLASDDFTSRTNHPEYYVRNMEHTSVLRGMSNVAK